MQRIAIRKVWKRWLELEWVQWVVYFYLIIMAVSMIVLYIHLQKGATKIDYPTDTKIELDSSP